MFKKQTAMRRRPRGSAGHSPWVSRLTALWTLAACLIGPAAAGAQSRTLTIIEPSEWRFGDTLVLGDRKVLRIHGSASDTSGVKQVLVNGQAATLKKDPKNPKFWLFDMTIPAESIPGRITLTLVPTKGPQVEQLYAADSPFIREQRRKAAAAATVAKVEPKVVTPVTTVPEPPAPPVRIADPWPPFKKRSIAYGVGAGAGVLLVVLSKSDNNCNTTSSTYNCSSDGGMSGGRAFGVGLVAASVVALGVDAFLTSRRDNRAKENVALKTSSSNAFQFAAPAIVDLHRGLGLGLLRLSLR